MQKIKLKALKAKLHLIKEYYQTLSESSFTDENVFRPFEIHTRDTNILSKNEDD